VTKNGKKSEKQLLSPSPSVTDLNSTNSVVERLFATTRRSGSGKGLLLRVLGGD
jgi:hypothetical protein